MTNFGPEVLALHGFLGLAADWSLIPTLPVRALDLWPHARRGTSWCAAVVNKPILLGYSMGGRLAMQAAVAEPERWSGAVFVSAHPGLVSGRAERLNADQAWAERFRCDPWFELMRDWNAQAVLASGVTLERREADFDREALACAMDVWSLGRQEDLRTRLVGLPFPVLYVTGERDEKFTALIGDLRLPNSQKHVVIAGAGHRVPWDRPAEFEMAVRNCFLEIGPPKSRK
jgi:2-succinyl-6-hydroxy-2,4-cyclohexadiene-1-carboxylate synthase